ncbi:Predicted arabinose efflux permease, MFS family [Pseudomonas cuatrocienegasensis]|uniref:Predicted arabinose efflux permease, MFS family n=1 Tax=Pseudomonas cuatrocienegasensis TaxID=543360 RepID=A0ABY1BBG9_9PSED|nr:MULTISPECIES: MFS transporter [Pseudomonas]OEC33211.1 MFS transporter [Pseudomonas sp. 21C1]SEQ45211.1 Predicted arabinose efflux permease, MFS family [Pseudomonas cuatrocienegasensis]
MNIKHHQSALQAPVENADRLPFGRLLALTMAGFLAIMTETMPAGLLPQIGQGLGVSEAFAGQLVTVYALGSVLAAIPVVAITCSWNRRPLLLLAIGSLLVFNTITALSTHYGLTLVARFIAGMAAGVVWGLLAGYARRLVAPHLQGRALAVAGVGQPIALTIGVPLGAWLGTLYDWRGVFWIMSALSLLLLAWVRLAVPDFAGQSARQRMPIQRIFMMPGVRPVLLALFAWMLAHNILYTYIAPFLASVGLGHRVDAVLLLFGVSSIMGIWITGLLVDRWLRALTLLSLAAFTVAALVLGFSSASPWGVLLGVATWGLTFGGAPTLLQTALADMAGDGADVAQSMLVTIFNLAVAGGGVLGGVLLERAGAPSLPWAMAALALLGLVVVWSANRHGFPTGRHVTHIDRVYP